MAFQPVYAFSHLLRGRAVGAHIRAALLFRHAHAERDAGFLHGRFLARIIFAGDDFRRPGPLDTRRGHDRRNRGVRHRDRAEMAAFKTRRQIEADGARLMGDTFFIRQAFPWRALQANGNGPAHQRVIGGVELDKIDALSGRTVGSQLRRRPVCNPREILRLRRSCEFSRRLELRVKRTRKRIRDVLQQRIGVIDIVARQRWGLVVFVGRRAARFLRAHDVPPIGIREVMHGGSPQ